MTRMWQVTGPRSVLSPQRLRATLSLISGAIVLRKPMIVASVSFFELMAGIYNRENFVRPIVFPTRPLLPVVRLFFFAGASMGSNVENRRRDRR